MNAPSLQPVVQTGEDSTADAQRQAQPQRPAQSPQRREQAEQHDDAPPPLMHFPHCRLEVIPFSHHHPHAGAGKLEKIALPGTMVRALLSRFENGEAVHQLPPSQQQQQLSASTSTSTPPTPTTPARPRHAPIRIQPHAEDADDWVFTRCILADFTNLREDEAQQLSANGQLCCWASVELCPPPPSSRGRRLGRREDGEGDGEQEEDAEAGGRWELGFVVQRVGVRDPGSGWCECF